MQHRTALISVAVLATFLVVTGASIAFVVLPAMGVEDAVRKKLRSEHALVRDVHGSRPAGAGNISIRKARRACPTSNLSMRPNPRTGAGP